MSKSDFFGDVNTDLVFQNSDGAVALWDMSGASILGAGVVAVSPGLARPMPDLATFRRKIRVLETDERQRSEPANRSWRVDADCPGLRGDSYLADCLLMARPTLIRLSAITPRPTQRCIPSSPR